jgi:hypothetical protein
MDTNVIIFADKCSVDNIGIQGIGWEQGPFALYNCLVIGHTKYNGMQRVYCNQFPKKQIYGSHWLDLIMIWPPGIYHGGCVGSPDTVWYARVCSYFLSQPRPTRAPKCLIVLSCWRWKHRTILRMVFDFIAIICIMDIIGFKMWQVLIRPDSIHAWVFFTMFYLRLIPLGIAMPLAKPMLYYCNYMRVMYHCYHGADW